MQGDMEHMNYLDVVAHEDIATLRHKESTYKGSWKKRGGVGASMMVLRKVDRLEEMLKIRNYDIFQHVGNGTDGTLLAEIRDLRRYLLLIEAEIISCNMQAGNQQGELIVDEIKPGTPENGGHHERSIPRHDEVKVLERLEDGLKLNDIPHNQRGYYMIAVGNGQGFNIVDRRKAPPEMWEHLPTLRLELNNKEHEEAPSFYQGLYEWNGTDNKWVLRKTYHPLWGRP